MDSTANILQFCRLCLVKDGVNIPIFDEQGDIRQIYLKISSCLPVKVAREDHLPKKICDGCSNKLDICYDFWRTSAESEKQLLAWLGATGKDAAQVNVKEEDNFDEPLASDISKNDDDENKCYMFEQKVEEGPPVEINDEPPPSKRPRRTAAVKAAIAMDQNSDDDGDSGEPITKMEDDSDETDGDDREPAFVDVPSTSADDQPGPSGVSKDGSDAPCSDRIDTFSQNKEEQGNTKDTQETVASECEEEVDEIIEMLALSGEPNNITTSEVQPNVLHVETEQDQEDATKTLKMKTKQAKEHICPICYKAYSSEGGMLDHSRLKHPMIKLGNKPPVFLWSLLKTHYKKKSNRVHYQCIYCINKFPAIKSVYSHLKRKHSGEAFELTEGASVALGKFRSSSATIPTESENSGTNKERLASVGVSNGQNEAMLHASRGSSNNNFRSEEGPGESKKRFYYKVNESIDSGSGDKGPRNKEASIPIKPRQTEFGPKKPNKDSSFGTTPGPSNHGSSNVVSKSFEKSMFGRSGQSQQLFHYTVSMDKEVSNPTIPDVGGERRGLKTSSSQEHFRNETGFRSDRNRRGNESMQPIVGEELLNLESDYKRNRYKSSGYESQYLDMHNAGISDMSKRRFESQRSPDDQNKTMLHYSHQSTDTASRSKEVSFPSKRQKIFHYKITDPESSDSGNKYKLHDSYSSSQGYLTSGGAVRVDTDRNEKFRGKEASARQNERFRSDRNHRGNEPYDSYKPTNAGARRESSLSSYGSSYEGYSSNVASGSYRSREVDKGLGYDPHSARRGISQSSDKKQFKKSSKYPGSYELLETVPRLDDFESVSQNAFTCVVCGASFISNAVLKMHVEVNHLEDLSLF